MAKKSKMSMGKMIMTIIAIVLAAATCIPLFVNVWNGVGVIGSETTVSELGGYFDDYSSIAKAFELADKTFMEWASMVAGIALIVALVGAVAYIIGAIINMVTGGGKIASMLTKLGSIVMIIAGIVILVTSILFTAPVLETTVFGAKASSSVGFAFGAWIGVIAPLAAGLIGMITSKE